MKSSFTEIISFFSIHLKNLRLKRCFNDFFIRTKVSMVLRIVVPTGTKLRYHWHPPTGFMSRFIFVHIENILITCEISCFSWLNYIINGYWSLKLTSQMRIPFYFFGLFWISETRLCIIQKIAAKKKLAKTVNVEHTQKCIKSRDKVVRWNIAIMIFD